MIIGLVLWGGNACLGVRAPCKNVFLFHINQSVRSPCAGDGLAAERGLALTLPMEITHQYKQGPCLYFLLSLFPEQRRTESNWEADCRTNVYGLFFFFSQIFLFNPVYTSKGIIEGRCRFIAPKSQGLRKMYSSTLGKLNSENLNNRELLNHRCLKLWDHRIFHSLNPGNKSVTGFQDHNCPLHCLHFSLLELSSFPQFTSASLPTNNAHSHCLANSYPHSCLS